MKRVVTPLMLCMFAGSVGVAGAQQNMSATQVQQKSITATRVDGTESVSTLTIVNERGQKRVRKMTGVSKMYAGGSLEKKLIRFTSPADVRDTGFLTYDYDERDDDKWMYMPALRKTRRIVSSENAKSFMGSEFSYADMTMPTVRDFNYRFLAPDEVNGESCYVIEVIPKNRTIEEENGFSKKISYISKNDFVQRKSVYFNLYGDREKVMTVKSIVEVDRQKHRYKMGEIEVVNVRNGRKSIMENTNIKFNPAIPDGFFSTRYLEK